MLLIVNESGRCARYKHIGKESRKFAMKEKLLKLLEEDSSLSARQFSMMLGITEEEVNAAVAEMEADGVILGYKAVVDWQKTKNEDVTALIELKVCPQRGKGFDEVAERIYNYPEVQTVYLMSGGFDLGVIIEGRTMKEVALFVAEKLAPMESVLSTATHFVLRTYKEHGMLYVAEPKDERGMLV